VEQAPVAIFRVVCPCSGALQLRREKVTLRQNGGGSDDLRFAKLQKCDFSKVLSILVSNVTDMVSIR
jgi:hypothetical protein